MKKNIKSLIRFEKFGGIIASEKPAILAFVDKDYIKHRYNKSSELWTKPDDKILSGPIEAHYSVTNFCPSECPGCYMGSLNNSKLKLSDKDSFNTAIKIADALVELKIFHVALGGGESFSTPWFTDLAEYFRAKGIIPNVTTNGYYINEDIIEKCRVFGQINVSLDGISDNDNPLRATGHFEKADSAIKLLKQNGIRVGINCIISRHNFDSLDNIVKYASKHRLKDIEFLRFKPAGRGKDIYHEMALTKEQGKALFPKMKKLSWRYRMNLKLDCSFTPFVCYHKPSKKVLEYFSILGCDAGNWLVGVNPDGNVSPCSFIEDVEIDYKDINKKWSEKETFKAFRAWDKNPGGKCSECDYLSICKGGCHAVSKFLTGSFESPDPECPMIADKV